jgi:transcriptional regulator with XRE-family HTH domain
MENRELRSLGGVIRARRKELGWTQEELAERVSALDEYVRQSDISRIERGEIMLPRRQRLERIAAALELSLGELLALSGWTGADLHFADKHATLVRAATDDATAADRLAPYDEAALAAIRQSTLPVAKLGTTFDRFQALTDSLRQRASELAAARAALNETRQRSPRIQAVADELSANV